MVRDDQVCHRRLAEIGIPGSNKGGVCHVAKSGCILFMLVYDRHSLP